MTHSSSLDDHRGNGWFVALGVVMILTGIGAFAFPLLASLSVELLVGATLLIGGIATFVQAFQEKDWGGVFWQIAIGIVYLAGGLVFLVNPFGGVIALTVLLGAVFFAEGIARVVMGIQMRSERNWGWVVASGAMSILLAMLVFGGFATGASLGLIGVLLGVNFIFAGASFIALGSAKSEKPDEQTA
ncbi:HdeD family acid-resistance protein [Ruegeria sp. R14_0]|uniref:HdeD family acid-resistance protein n=1 Tax=Ruegeria sp. R14_0 TaxID=2821100 RepID=UPI001ADCFDBE|nr:HdeD family acid-resistance protein [Ruegeria sp. R14_0]MBO9448216.1 HdeD family acid-resistance protein [Ruegeria sp. R14_0]